MKHSHSKLIGILGQMKMLWFTSTVISEFAWQMYPIPNVNVQMILKLAQVILLMMLHRWGVDVVQSPIPWMSHSFIMLSTVRSPLSKKN